MSIISNVTAEPIRVEMLIDYLKTTSRQHSKQDLDVMFSPPHGKQNEESKTSTFKDVYTVVESLGLIRVEDDLVKLNISNKKTSTLKHIKNIIFEKEFVEKDNIALAIAWLQTQKSIKPLHWSAKIIDVVNSDLNDNYDGLDLTGTDATRWRHFGYWCIYLGFATKIYIDGNIYICPDPTEAISNELHDIFSIAQELKIKDFLFSLSSILPVLEGGVIRKNINDSVREGLQLPENILSLATSLALLRLEHRTVIKLIHKSDADSISIQDNDSNHIVSHIEYLGNKDEL